MMIAHNKNNGFSLVELMIAMVLGLFLVAGVGTVYLSAKKTFAVNEQVSGLDENARVALRTLTQHIEHAGYASTSGMKLDNYILPTDMTITSSNCLDGSASIARVNRLSTSQDSGYSFGSNGIYPDTGRGDTIGLLFLSDTDLKTDCIGEVAAYTNQCVASPIMEARLIYNSFHIARGNKNSLNHDIPVLRCSGSLHAGAQPWAEGVENIQFLYGIDSNSDGATENYWNATSVEAASAWGQIISVRVGVLMRSVEPAFRTAQVQSFQVLDELINTNDRYKREVYSTTIRLKNVARRM